MTSHLRTIESSRRGRIAWESIALLLLALALPSGVRAQRGATLAGTIHDSIGRPIVGAEVWVLGAGARARSDASGAYYLVSQLAGRATVTARRLGYLAQSRQLRLVDGEEHRLDFVLPGGAQSLEGDTVTATRDVFESRLAGFNARSRLQVGHFVTRERIDRANSATLLDILREIPGLRIGGSTVRGRSVRLRSATCAPLVFIDGFPASAGEFDLDMIDLASVEGIEVYSGLGSTPPQFIGPRDLDRCGVIAIWSRPARVRARRERTAEVPALVPTAKPLTHDEVDAPARPDSGTVAPEYPDSLWRAGTMGRVVLEFVVDTAGFVEPMSVTVLEATDQLFANAARAALGRAHFRAGMVRGRPVRQYLQLPFTFNPGRPIPPSPAPLRPAW